MLILDMIVCFFLHSKTTKEERKEMIDNDLEGMIVIRKG